VSRFNFQGSGAALRSPTARGRALLSRWAYTEAVLETNSCMVGDDEAT
jgi:hypothetical protein